MNLSGTFSILAHSVSCNLINSVSSDSTNRRSSGDSDLFEYREYKGLNQSRSFECLDVTIRNVTSLQLGVIPIFSNFL